jgi:hypothetical protein
MSCRKDPPAPTADAGANRRCDDPNQPCPLGNLIVHVHRDTSVGPAISGAAVNISGPETGAGTTDAAGRAEFNKIQPGPYTVTARKDVHTPDPVSGSASVPTGGTQQIDLVLTPIALEIVDRKTGAVVSGTTQTKIVGQKIELQVRTRPPGLAMTGIQWTVPGERVKNYTQSAAAGTRTDLAPADLQAANLDFYWIAGGARTVSVAATVQGAPLTAQVQHSVLAPTGVVMTSATGNVAVGATGFPGDPPMNLFYGTNVAVGIRWTCTATAPAGGGGEIAATQLVNTLRSRTPNAGAAKTLSSGGAFVLDSSVPYDAAVAVSAGASATWTSNDSPSTALTATLSAKSVADSFKIYFMYKPAGGDSIWVTLKRLDWHWAGATTRVGAPAGVGNNWTAPTGVGSDVNPSGAASTELPTWTANVTSLVWT